MRSSPLLAAAFVAAPAAASLYKESSLNHTCAIQPSFRSCSAYAYPNKTDSCCTETYGGLLLQTQFWDVWADKDLPANTWTLHGLWPDFCNGSYTQYCDLSRQYDPSPSPNTTNGLKNGTAVPPYKGPNIGTFLIPFGKYDLLAWMNKFWIAQTGPNADFWGHEFSKHATCYSTFDVPCYGPTYRNHSEVVDFFETVAMYYLRRPTWEWLTRYNIVPSNTTTYSLSQLEYALTSEYGALPYLGCSGPRFNETAAGKNSTDNGYTQLSEVWYYMHVDGRPQDGRDIPVDNAGASSCAKTPGAIRYLARASANSTTLSSWTPWSRGPWGPWAGWSW